MRPAADLIPKEQTPHRDAVGLRHFAAASVGETARAGRFDLRDGDDATALHPDPKPTDLDLVAVAGDHLSDGRRLKLAGVNVASEQDRQITRAFTPVVDGHHGDEVAPARLDDDLAVPPVYSAAPTLRKESALGRRETRGSSAVARLPRSGEGR